MEDMMQYLDREPNAERCKSGYGEGRLNLLSSVV
jgi:hypothetical protein